MGKRMIVVSQEDLAALAAALHEADEALWAGVAQARLGPAPLTWAEIGEALGMSRQAAWEKHTLARRGKSKAVRAPLQKEELPLGRAGRSRGTTARNGARS